MSILSQIGLPENIVPPLPPGAKDGSPYSIGLANQQASMNKMSGLLKVTQGGGKMRRHRSIKRGRHLLKGGATITLPPLNVPYPGGAGLNDTFTRLATTAVNSTEQSKYDTAWVKPSVGGSIKRSKRSITHGKKRRSIKHGVGGSKRRSIKRRSSKRRRSIKHGKRTIKRSIKRNKRYKR